MLLELISSKLHIVHIPITVAIFSKCWKYSPTESNKTNNKTSNWRGGIVFEPVQVVAMVKQQAITTDKVVLSNEESIRQFLEVKSEFCHHWTLHIY